jgi:D-glycero-alpha-D-manno-heptose-7-phosphate kinase
MIIRSKSPLRLGLAGGGTDVSSYSDIYGGFVLNATIDMYVYCTIEETRSAFIEFSATDINKEEKCLSMPKLNLDGNLDLHKGVYNRIINDFNSNIPLSFKLTTYSDAPPGSGLGSSSAVVVAILKAFVEWLSLPLGEYEIAQLAYQIEREDIGLSGGKQDQYAAVFGGFNFMEFYKEDRVIINPLRVKNWIKDELEASIVLYYTGASRSSAEIIDQQEKNISQGNMNSIESMHALKNAAVTMKEAILKGDIDSFAEILGNSWNQKKKIADKISNSMIDEIFETALAGGAKAGKVSGAGGGGFIIFMVDPIKKSNLIEVLQKFDGQVTNFHFSEGGCHGWKIFRNRK